MATAIGQHCGSDSSGVDGHVQHVVRRAQIVEDLLDRREIRFPFSIGDHQQLHVDRRCRAGGREGHGKLGLRGWYCGREEHEGDDKNSGGNNTKA